MADSVKKAPAGAYPSMDEVHAFQRAVEDHRFLSEYVANVGRSTALFNQPHPRVRIAGMKAFLTEHVMVHFAFEEKQVFPQLLARERARATRRAVADLVEEHVAMKAAVRNLRGRMRRLRAADDDQALDRLERSFRDFLDVLQAHAVKEDNLLLAVKQSRRHATPLG